MFTKETFSLIKNTDLASLNSLEKILFFIVAIFSMASWMDTESQSTKWDKLTSDNLRLAKGMDSESSSITLKNNFTMKESSMMDISMERDFKFFKMKTLIPGSMLEISFKAKVNTNGKTVPFIVEHFQMDINTEKDC
jgi:hypothetical protein